MEPITVVNMKIEEVTKYSKNNIEKLEEVHNCGCYFCLRIFDPEEIMEFTDQGTTALCPFCGVDAIVPGMVNKVWLEKAHIRWFTDKQ